MHCNKVFSSILKINLYFVMSILLILHWEFVDQNIECEFAIKTKRETLQIQLNYISIKLRAH